MEGRCERHLFDQAIDLCERCGAEFCGDCLVYSFGPKKPPYCLPCAVEQAGVRKGAIRPAVSRRDRKRLVHEREKLFARRDSFVARDDPLVQGVAIAD
jgi:hypothetical protein